MSPQAQEAWLGRVESSSNPPPQLITFLHEERGAAFECGWAFSLSAPPPRRRARVMPDSASPHHSRPRGRHGPVSAFGRHPHRMVRRRGGAETAGSDPQARAGPHLAQGSRARRCLNGRLTLGLRHGQPAGEFKPLIRLPGGSALRYQQFSSQVDSMPPRPPAWRRS